MDGVVFYVSAVLLVYTYAGYPLLIAIWSRLWPRPLQRGSAQPRVAIIVVAHNEEARIAAKLRSCLEQDYPAERTRIIVVTDGSSDRTNSLVLSSDEPRVHLLPFATRRGKAACLNDAAVACTEDILVFTDARQALNRQAVRCLVETLGDPRVGVVSGELVFVRDGISNFGDAVDAYWRYEKFIRQSEARVHSAAGATGALYAIRKACFVPIPERTILDDVAIPMQSVRAGYRTVFDARAIAYDRPSQSAAQEKVRKVRTLAGNYQLITLMPWLLLPGANPIFVQYVSHKLLRLVAPFAMLAVLLANASLALASTWYAAVLTLQVLCYGLAVVALFSAVVARWRPARLASSFLVMNWYAVLGLAHFLAHRSGHLWNSPPAAKTP